MNRVTLYSSKLVFVIVAVFSLGMMLGGCASSSKEEKAPPPTELVTGQKDSLKEQPPEEAIPEPVTEQKGSLSRTFTLVDEQGRKSGTLTLDPVSGATLRDENGNIVGKFKAESTPEPQSVASPPTSQPVEASSGLQPAAAPQASESGETPSAPEPSDQLPADETQH